MERKKQDVKISVNVRRLKNLQYGEKFKTVSNNGKLSDKTYTKEEYDRKTKKYDIGNSRKQFPSNQKVVTHSSIVNKESKCKHLLPET